MPRKYLLFSSMMLAGFTACNPEVESEKHNAIIPDSGSIHRVDTLSAKPTEINIEESSAGDAKKPGNIQADPLPKPRPDKPTELDSIKKSYPPKK